MIIISLSFAILFISSASDFNIFGGGRFGSSAASMSNVLRGGEFDSPFDSDLNGTFGELGPPLDTSNIGSSGGFGSSSVFYNKDNLDAVKIHKNVTTSIITKYGDSVQFECYASGTAPVKITWTKRGYYYGDPRSSLLPNGKTEYEGNILQIPSVTQTSQGTYICTANNMEYFNDIQTYTLEVKSEPLITEALQTNKFGFYILLKCTAYCNPKSTFKWYKNGQLLTIEDKDEVDAWHHDSLDSSIKSVLDIPTKNNDYEGSYKCEIENEFGKDEQVFEINGKHSSDSSD